jgi:hypothetical protein
MLLKTQNEYYKTFFWWLIAACIIIIFAVGYLQTEILTNAYSPEIPEISALCAKRETELKYFKIIKYEKSRKELLLQCVYMEKLENSEIIANLIGEKWVKVRVNKLNEKGGLYWPIYL